MASRPATGPAFLTRREFIARAALGAAVAALPLDAMDSPSSPATGIARPRAITMWDFSWIERRWSGAGYEDWPRVLDELVARGYDAVRIDAFPHLVATDPQREWTLVPVWNVQDWGSPAKVQVRLLPALHEFVRLCRDRGIRVGLSTWYREDEANTRLRISSAEVMAEQWNATLAGLSDAGLLDAILYVDLCNEWPGALWCPFFHNQPPELTWGGWYTEASLTWMRAACGAVRRAFPQLPVGFSFEIPDPAKLAGRDLAFLDYAEPHLWMAQANDGEFYKQVGYKYDRFSNDSYVALEAHGEPLYRSDPGRWQQALRQHILTRAAALQPHGLPLMTTECWGVVDFKDSLRMHWDWVQELCRIGVETAAGTGQWLAIASSNFTGPQFHGMWRDVAWHREITALIKRATIRPGLLRTKLAARL